MTPASAGALRAAKGLALAVAAVLLGSPLRAQGAPDTDVWLAPLSRVGDSLVVGTPKNVTKRVGYDNQPSFTPDSKAILYTAVVDGQAEIFRYELASGAITRLTNTAESEYSATVTPDGKWFSVVRVEKDSTQRLWKFPLAGGEPKLVLENVKPVGYHAWVDDTTLALYVLGRPATLVLATTGGRTATLASGIGRGLALFRSAPMIAYVRRDSTRFLLAAQPVGADRFNVVPAGEKVMHVPGNLGALPANEFFTFADARTILSADGTRIVATVPPTGAWTPIVDLASSGVRNVTRLAVSPDGKWLAFVAEPVAPGVTK